MGSTIVSTTGMGSGTGSTSKVATGVSTMATGASGIGELGSLVLSPISIVPIQVMMTA